MPIVTRDDATSFAVYTYRETLTAKKATLLKQEIAMLQEEHGDYARFFTQPDGSYECVFSRDKGYLLGESVWYYLDNPYDLIYCEALPDGVNALLVVVRAGNVYLDASLPKINLQDEFASLSTGTNQYDIYTYGDVPLAEQIETGKFNFDDSLVKSFTQLDESLFNKLPHDSDLALLTVEQAINELDLTKGKVPMYVVGLILLAAFGFAIWALMPEEEPVLPLPTKRAEPKDPMLGFKQELRTPAPDLQLMELVTDIRQIFTLPGWVPISIKYENGQAITDLESIGGTADILLAWTRANNAILKVESGKATITINSDLRDRPEPTVIYNLGDMTSKVYDEVKMVVPAGAVTIGSTVDQGAFYETEITIQFSEVSTDILVIFAQELADLPVVLDRVEINVRDGLLSGSIYISVLGVTA